MKLIERLLYEGEELISYDSFRGQILNNLEMYYENLSNEEDDTFAGTEDSYANEVFEQNLFDILYHAFKPLYDKNGEGIMDSKAAGIAEEEMDNIIDALNTGEVISFKNDILLKNIYEKHFGAKEEPREEIKESVNNELSLNLNPISSNLQMVLSEFRKLDNKFLDTDSDIRFAYENMLTDLEDINNKFKEFQGIVGGKNENN